MKRIELATWLAVAFALSNLGTAQVAAADEDEARVSRFGVSLATGVHAFNQNDTSLPDHFVNVPGVATVSYRVSHIVDVGGDFTWVVPVKQSVDMGAAKQDLETPAMLAYMGDVRARWPLASWSPYVAAGAGAVTFLSNTDANRVPQLNESQTMFAVNFGTGADLGLTPRWAVRVDFRELVAFPSNDAAGLSNGGNADAIWMERGTVGLAYEF